MKATAKEPSVTDRVHLVSLGCPKNRVDSEVMVGKLHQGSWEMTDKPLGGEGERRC